jgi:hypothetical protein
MLCDYTAGLARPRTAREARRLKNKWISRRCGRRDRPFWAWPTGRRQSTSSAAPRRVICRRCSMRPSPRTSPTRSSSSSWVIQDEAGSARAAQRDRADCHSHPRHVPGAACDAGGRRGTLRCAALDRPSCRRRDGPTSERLCAPQRRLRTEHDRGERHHRAWLTDDHVRCRPADTHHVRARAPPGPPDEWHQPCSSAGRRGAG